MTDLLDDMFAAMRADNASVPVTPLVCVVPKCGLPMVEMVYRHRPDGMSVYEPRCRDHKDVGDLHQEVTR